MATATLDCNEHGTMQAQYNAGGTYRSLTRYALVTELTQTGPGALAEAIQATNMPSLGSRPTSGSDLRLQNVDVQILDAANPTKAVCTLNYVPSGQYLSTTPRYESGSGFYQVQKETDLYGLPVYVQHTFPNDDPDFPGQTRYQGGSVTVNTPTVERRATFLAASEYPDYDIARWTGKLNSTSWGGSNPGAWMCMSVIPEEWDMTANPPVYKWTFEFLALVEGNHNPRLVYIDSRTGAPPPGIIQGLGIKTVTSYGWLDYNELFPNAQILPEGL